VGLAGLPWYAIRVRSNAEKTVFNALGHKGYDPYLPLYRKRTQWSDRVKDLECALFPGYVFCPLDLAHRHALLSTPGVVSLVGFGGTAVPIPASEIESVRTAVSSGLPSVPWPFIKEGDRVRVCRGSMKGLEGLLVQDRGRCRVLVSVELLQRSIAVEIDRDWVEPLAASVVGIRPPSANRAVTLR
jgi:transcription antitermination factor NusG